MDKHKDPVINRVHALTNANNCTKYEQDPGKIVGNREIMNQNSKPPHKISKCHGILRNNPRDPIINRVHALIKDNGCPKYDQDSFHIVGCRVVTKAA